MRIISREFVICKFVLIIILKPQLNFFNGLSIFIMNKVFQVTSLAPYAPRDKNKSHSEKPKMMTNGAKSILILAPKIWSTKIF